MQPSITVSEIMSTPVVAISPSARVHEVFALAEARKIHHFPVVDRGSLVGFVCTCDLADSAPHELVSSRCWHHPATVSRACSAPDAARLLLLHGVGSLVIVDNEGLHGIVTSDDLRRASPTLERILEDAHCSECGVGEHLRPGPDGTSICARCKRAKAHPARPSPS